MQNAIHPDILELLKTEWKQDGQDAPSFEVVFSEKDVYDTDPYKAMKSVVMKLKAGDIFFLVNGYESGVDFQEWYIEEAKEVFKKTKEVTYYE